MENQLFIIQEQRFKTIKDFKGKEGGVNQSRRKSLMTSRSQSDKNMLKTTGAASKRSSLAKIYNV